MNKFYIANVNYIMTFTVRFGEDVLMSYRPHNNVLWDDARRISSFQEFNRRYASLIGKGEVVLMENEDGNLTEYYTGFSVTPVQASYFDTPLNDGPESYYRAKNIANDGRLYIPKGFLREVSEKSEFQELLIGLFKNRENQEIIEEMETNVGWPLMMREAYARQNAAEARGEKRMLENWECGRYRQYHPGLILSRFERQRDPEDYQYLD